MTMKTDYLSCTRELYFAEKILGDGASLVGTNIHASIRGMTLDVVGSVCAQLEQRKVLSWHKEFRWVEDEDGQEIEVEYDEYKVNKTALKKDIIHTREENRLRETPFAPRETLFSIAQEVENILGKEVWMRIVSKFMPVGDVIYLFGNGYTLVDFLFRRACATEETQQLSPVLAEFLNPIYYDIHNADTAKKLFNYIDKVLAISANTEDYEKWLNEGVKYTVTARTTTVSDEDVKFYITGKGEDFYYNGRCLNLSKNTDYYKVFSILYAKYPKGGEISYKELAIKIKEKIPRTKKFKDEGMRKFIQRNLTEKKNGFFRFAGISETEDSGKPLIKIVRGSGVAFNNKAL